MVRFLCNSCRNGNKCDPLFYFIFLSKISYYNGSHKYDHHRKSRRKTRSLGYVLNSKCNNYYNNIFIFKYDMGRWYNWL